VGPRRRVGPAIAGAMAAVAACGGASPASPPVQDHVHAAVPGPRPGEILLATHDGLRISDDAGRTWPAAGDLAHAQMRLLLATGTGFVAVTARDDGSSEVLHSREGRHWSPSTGVLPGHPVAVLSAGAAPAQAWMEVTGAGILGSDDGGASWRPVLPTPLTINDIAAGVGDPQRLLYASSTGLFVARGPDLTPLFDAPVLDGDVLTVRRWHACAACLVAVTGGAVATSADGGLAWTEHPTTIPFTDVESWSGGGGALLGLVPAPGSPQHGVYRSADGGASWTRVLDAPLVDRLLLRDGAALLAFRWGISVYSSDDGGVTWTAAGPLRP
jgi:photosystem II stability/assembly factor-like uncharacterized protein